VFGHPGATFSALIARPTWWLPYVLGALLSGALGASLGPKVDIERSVRSDFDARAERTGVPIEGRQIQTVIDSQERMKPYLAPVAILGYSLYFFFVAAILQIVARALGGDTRTSELLAVFSYAQTPNLIGQVIALVVVASAADGSLTMEQARHPVVSSLAALLPAETGGVVGTFATSIDVFTLAILALLIVGLSRLRGLPRRAALGIPLTLWGFFVLLKLGFAAVFG